MKEFRITFTFEKEHTRSLTVNADNRNEIIEEIKKSSWIGNDELQINLAKVTGYKIREL